jgi:hypothetical protein
MIHKNNKDMHFFKNEKETFVWQKEESLIR